MPGRRDQALALSEELLSDIELNRLAPADVARKAFRLARLLDDLEAINWLRYELEGYPQGGAGLPPEAWTAAGRSNRIRVDPTGAQRAPTGALGELQASVDAALAQLASASDPDVSITSANPSQIVQAPQGNTQERSAVRNYASTQRATIDRVVGSILGM